MPEVVSGWFIWDAEKEQRNVERHGISFAEAITVFLDPDRLVVFDPQHSDREMRFFCIGLTGHGATTVRFTLRQDKIRIIGAGRWRKWRKIYESKKDLR